MHTKHRRTGNSSFQLYKIVVSEDANGKKTKRRVQLQQHVPGDMPILGNSHAAFRADYGDKQHRTSYVKAQKAYGKKVPAKVNK